MGIPKKGSRKITIDEVVYRWHIRHRPSYGQAIGESSLTVAVELYDRPNSKLLIQFPYERPDSWTTPSPHPPTVSPQHVGNAIRLALEQGWQPGQPGKPFQIEI